MAITIPGTAVSGGAQTGFTTPTHTYGSVDKAARETNGFVTALAGQPSARVHSISDPFKLSFQLPTNYRMVGQPRDGVLGMQPKNVTRVRLWKGVVPLSGQASQLMDIDCRIAIPAGADSADAANVRAALSAFIGALNSLSSGLGDTTIQGTL